MQTLTARLDSRERIESQSNITDSLGVNWENFVELESQYGGGEKFHKILDYLREEGVLTLLQENSYFFVTQGPNLHQIAGTYHFKNEDDARNYQRAYNLKHDFPQSRLMLSKMVDGFDVALDKEKN